MSGLVLAEPGAALVSVVVANHNMGKYLSKAVDSVLGQSYAPLEVVVVDDGSTDDSRDVLRRYEQDKRVRLVLQDNSGQARAKNRGIRESTGEFIAFVDADDIWTPDKLEKQMPVFHRGPNVGVVYTNFAYVDQQGRNPSSPRRQYFSGTITGQLLVENFVNGMTSVIRRRCLEQVGLFDESLDMGIDYDLWLRISKFYEFQFLDEVTYFYRIWPGQMSHRWKRRFQNGVFIMERFLRENPGLVPTEAQSLAWAHTYLTAGNCYLHVEKDRVSATKWYLRSVRSRWNYAPAWKGLAKAWLHLRGCGGRED